MRRAGSLLLWATVLACLLPLFSATPAEALRKRSVSVSVSTTTVATGDPVRFSGKVSSTGRGATVRLQRWTGKRWVTSRSARTTAGGRYAITLRPTRAASSPFRVAVPRTKRSAGARSASRRVNVLTRTSISVSTTRELTTGDVAVFRARLSPRTRNAPLRLQRRVGSSWVQVSGARTDSAGGAVLRHRPAVGTSRYRVLAPRHARRAASASATITVTVTRTTTPTPDPSPSPTSSPGPTPSPSPSPSPSPTDAPTPPPSSGQREVSGPLTSTDGWRRGEVVRVVGETTVPAGTSLTIPADVVLAFDGVSLVVEGTLRLGDGVTLTASADPAVIGTLPGDAPRVQNWPGLRVVGGGHADLSTAQFRRARTAVSVGETSSAAWHGAVRDSWTGLVAHGYVDARGVDWGDPGGPSPYGSGASVQGYGAQVVPWAGHVPAELSSAAVQVGDLLGCDDVVVLGARGSGESPDPGESYEDIHHLGLGGAGLGVAWGVWEKVAEQRPDASLAMRPVRYPAYDLFGTDGILIDRWPRFVDSVQRGAAAFAAEVEQLADRCPSTRVVAVGSSQGASVVRLGLHLTDPDARQTVSAVVLVGDVSRQPDAAETVLQTGGRAAPPDLLAVGGQVPLGAMIKDVPDALPSDVVDRTTSLCSSDDVFCAARRGGTLAGHLSYTWTDDLRPAGHHAAARALADLH